MSSIRTYNFSHEELEDFADAIKRLTVDKLVNEGLLDYDQANEWCATHTPIARKKTIFRTLCKRWEDMEEVAGNYWIVVEG